MIENNATYKRAILKGIPVSSGIAIGAVHILKNDEIDIFKGKIDETEINHHKNEFLKARDALVLEMQIMADGIGADAAEIIESQVLMIQDPEIEKIVKLNIEKNFYTAEQAVVEAYQLVIEKLRQNKSDFFKQRITDIANIKNRFVDLLQGATKSEKVQENAVVIAKNISPAELIKLYKTNIAGLVLENGGTTSHAVLLSRALNIPCLVGVQNACDIQTTQVAILNVDEGEFIVNPDLTEVELYKNKIQKKSTDFKQKIEGKTQNSAPNLSGKIKISTNLEFLAELPSIQLNGVEDIGLLRTEWLYLQNKTSEEEQLYFYEQVLKNIKGTVTIRLFDIGGDKTSATETVEENPFLGLRGIRYLLAHKRILITQLKAILKIAGKYPGRVKLLVPMVAIIEEVDQIKNVIEQVKKELVNDNIPIDLNLPLGLMIEVPSAAIMAETFAKKVDFFSVGTNDLTQYVMAADRGNKKTNYLYKQYHPAVFKLIKMALTAAENNNIELSVCGELAGNKLGACALVGMGVKNLSMNSNSVEEIKSIIHTNSEEKLKNFTHKILTANHTKEIEAWYKNNLELN